MKSSVKRHVATATLANRPVKVREFSLKRDDFVGLRLFVKYRYTVPTKYVHFTTP